MAQCIAKSKRSGERCRRDAMRGHDKCHMHAGKRASQVKAEVAARNGAAAVLAKHGPPTPVSDPLSALADLAGELLQFKDATASLIGSLDEVRYKGAGGEQLRAEVALYERASERAGRLLVDIARLDIDSRLVAISEAQARHLEVVLLGVLAHFGVNGRDVEVRQVVAQQLDALPQAVRP